MDILELSSIETMSVYGMEFKQVDSKAHDWTDFSHTMKSGIGAVTAHVGAIQIIMEFKNGNMSLGPRVVVSFRYESEITEDVIRNEIRVYLERLMRVVEADIKELDIKRAILKATLDELQKGEHFMEKSK